VGERRRCSPRRGSLAGGDAAARRLGGAASFGPQGERGGGEVRQPDSKEVQQASNLRVGGAAVGFPEQALRVAWRLAHRALAAAGGRVLPPRRSPQRRVARVPALFFLFLFFGCKSFYKFFPFFLKLCLPIFFSLKFFFFLVKTYFLEKVSH